MMFTVTAVSVATVLGALIWMLHMKQQARIEALEGRLSHLTAGLSLLTDTTEGGLRDIATELARQAAIAPAMRPRTRAATQSRVASAARRGRSVPEIAASEQVSEGEVRLRLNLNKSLDKDKAHAAVR